MSRSICFTHLKKKNTQHIHDNDIGVAVIDAFTHYVLQFMEKINKTSQVSMQELVRNFFLKIKNLLEPRLTKFKLFSSTLSM